MYDVAVMSRSTVEDHPHDIEYLACRLYYMCWHGQMMLLNAEHKLCIDLMNLDQLNGEANETLAEILETTPNVLQVKILNGNHTLAPKHEDVELLNQLATDRMAEHRGTPCCTHGKRHISLGNCPVNY